MANLAHHDWSPRPNCPLCSSVGRLDIDQKLLLAPNPISRGESLRKNLQVSRSAMNKHLEHIGSDVTAVEDYGTRLLQTLEVALQDCRDIVQEAREDGSYAAAVNGIKAIGTLIETQAKLVGLASASKQKSVAVTMSLPDDELNKLAQNFRDTVVIDGK